MYQVLKSAIHISLLIFVFFVGWFSRNFFDPVKTHTPGLVVGVDITEKVINESKNNASVRPAQDEVDATSKSAAENNQKTFNRSLIEPIHRLLFQNRITEASKLIRENATQFAPKDIEVLGSIFTTYALYIGLDNYQSSFELMNIEAKIASMDLHSPSAQFFDVIEQAGIDPLTALANFDELSSYYQEQVKAKQLLQLESWLISRVEGELISQKNWAALEDWYHTLIERSIEPGDLYRRLAALYYDLNRNLESLEVLDELAAYSGWNAEDEKLYQANTVAVSSDSVEAIVLQRSGEHYIATIRIDNRVNAAMLLDTGASISGLDSQFVRSQGFRNSGRKIRLSTAGGRVESDLIRLKSVVFGDNELVNLDVASIGLGSGSQNSRYQGLLGMDVLGKFEFYLDQRQAILYLRSISAEPQLPPEF